MSQVVEELHLGLSERVERVSRCSVRVAVCGWVK